MIVKAIRSCCCPDKSRVKTESENPYFIQVRSEPSLCVEVNEHMKQSISQEHTNAMRSMELLSEIETLKNENEEFQKDLAREKMLHLEEKEKNDNLVAMMKRKETDWESRYGSKEEEVKRLRLEILETEKALEHQTLKGDNSPASDEKYVIISKLESEIFELKKAKEQETEKLTLLEGQIRESKSILAAKEDELKRVKLDLKGLKIEFEKNALNQKQENLNLENELKRWRVKFYEKENENKSLKQKYEGEIREERKKFKLLENKVQESQAILSEKEKELGKLKIDLITLKNKYHDESVHRMKERNALKSLESELDECREMIALRENMEVKIETISEEEIEAFDPEVEIVEAPRKRVYCKEESEEEKVFPEIEIVEAPRKRVYCKEESEEEEILPEIIEVAKQESKDETAENIAESPRAARFQKKKLKNVVKKTKKAWKKLGFY